jgi:TPP-dependent pyruvate/acetoin dehydrogenase alpha subunit
VRECPSVRILVTLRDGIRHERKRFTYSTLSVPSQRERTNAYECVQPNEKGRGPDTAALERMLYYMKVTRAAEAHIEEVLYRQGKIVGGVYTGRGQEAIGAGSSIQLGDGDVILPGHRDFSSFLIRGVKLREILCNWHNACAFNTGCDQQQLVSFTGFD